MSSENIQLHLTKSISKMRFAIIGTGAIGQEHLRNLLLMSKREKSAATQQEQPGRDPIQLKCFGLLWLEKPLKFWLETS